MMRCTYVHTYTGKLQQDHPDCLPNYLLISTFLVTERTIQMVRKSQGGRDLASVHSLSKSSYQSNVQL